MVHMKVARRRLPNAKYILENTFFWGWGRVQGGEKGGREKFQVRKKCLTVVDMCMIVIVVMISWVYSHVKTYQLYT